MLVLSRKPQQKIKLLQKSTGEEIVLTVCSIKGGSIRIGIAASNDVRIIRSELEIDPTKEPEPKAA